MGATAGEGVIVLADGSEMPYPSCAHNVSETDDTGAHGRASASR